MFTIAGGIVLAIMALWLWPVTLGVLGGYLTFWAITIVLVAAGLGDVAVAAGLIAAVGIGITIPVKIYKALHG